MRINTPVISLKFQNEDNYQPQNPETGRLAIPLSQERLDFLQHNYHNSQEMIFEGFGANIIPVNGQVLDHPPEFTPATFARAWAALFPILQDDWTYVTTHNVLVRNYAHPAVYRAVTYIGYNYTNSVYRSIVLFDPTQLSVMDNDALQRLIDNPYFTDAAGTVANQPVMERLFANARQWQAAHREAAREPIICTYQDHDDGITQMYFKVTVPESRATNVSIADLQSAISQLTDQYLIHREAG